MNSGKISCGIAIPQTLTSPSSDIDFIRRFLSRAEALGYEGVWVQEQIVGDVPLLEPVTLLTYAAAITVKPHLGTSVLITGDSKPGSTGKDLGVVGSTQQWPAHCWRGSRRCTRARSGLRRRQRAPRETFH